MDKTWFLFISRNFLVPSNPNSAKLFLTTVPSVTLRNGEEGRRRAGPEEGEEVGREEVMGDS